MTRIPANLIINADDFGLHPRVSRAIAQCLDEGLINSFSVLPLADGDQATLLRSLLARHPGARVGAHLSLLEAGNVTGDVDVNGNGDGLREHPGHFLDFLQRYITGRHPAERVHREWRAQILALGEYLGGPDRLAHLDSHQHLHVLPGLWPVARALQREFRIPRLRVPYESLAGNALHRFPFGLGLQALARLRMRADSPGFIGFRASTAFTAAAHRRALRAVLSRPDRTFELMVHPALPPAGTAENGAVLAASQYREIEELRAALDLLTILPEKGGGK